MKYPKQQDGKFRIDRQGYDTDDTGKKMERVDVSPFGTEGIFIDIDVSEKIEEEK
jgi:hypothetical protein